MATSLTPAVLTVQISENINLNGQPINCQNTLEIEDIDQFNKRVMAVPTGSEVTLVLFSSAVAAGQYVRDNVKYVRITNLDTANYARIRCKKTGAETFDQKLDAGKSMIMGNARASVSATAAAFTTFVDLDSISAQAYTADVDLEFVVAST